MNVSSVARRGLSVVFCLLFFAGMRSSDAQEGQIPITTASDAAREAYNEARALQLNLKMQESLPYYEKAIAEDPGFAIAYFDLAFAQAATGNLQGMFANLDKAVALAEGVSDGERLLILGGHAGVHDNPAGQRELILQLVGQYPKATRARYALGLYLYGQREFSSSAEQLEKATKLSPDFAPAYNNLGYAYSRLGKYDEAEMAFKTYAELVPDEPNPHDSLGELLMKIGEFDESIAAYKQALARDPAFYASYVGVGMNLVFKGNPVEGRVNFQKLYDIAPADAQRRQALFWMAVSYVDEGSFDEALQMETKRRQIAEASGDPSAIAGDHGITGDILLHAGDVDGAEAEYRQAAEVIAGSDLSQEVKDEASQALLFNEARVALARDDVATAKAKADAYREQAQGGHDPLEMEISHQLGGMIALHEERFEDAIGELSHANHRDPRNLCRLAQAYEGRGDKGKAREMWAQAADFNELNYGYAFIRSTAKAKLAEM